MEKNEEILDSVLETYRCILSCRKKMPGMRLEEAFDDAAMADIEWEYEWLLSLQEKNEISADAAQIAAEISGKRVHELKTWPFFFEEIIKGTKTFEVRNDDRGFQVGDVLLLREFDNGTKKYSGRTISRLIKSKFDSNQVSGLERGYCILGLDTIRIEIEKKKS